MPGHPSPRRGRDSCRVGEALTKTGTSRLAPSRAGGHFPARGASPVPSPPAQRPGAARLQPAPAAPRGYTAASARRAAEGRARPLGRCFRATGTLSRPRGQRPAAPGAPQAPAGGEGAPLGREPGAARRGRARGSALPRSAPGRRGCPTPRPAGLRPRATPPGGHRDESGPPLAAPGEGRRLHSAA